jgi:PAP2 superfamily protein
VPDHPHLAAASLEEASARAPEAAGGASAAGRPPVVREVALLLALFLAYRLGRVLIAGPDDLAMANAAAVWDAERWLRLPDEQAWQAWALRWTGLVSAANWYYVAVHFPLTALFLAWGWWRRTPGDYRWARRLIIRLTGLAFVIHALIPLAPPRMMAGLGFVDTMAAVGPSAYGGNTGTVANQFAAMPSLHVGWALLLAFVVVSTTDSRWRWLTLAHPVITTLVVVVTANHYWVDGLVSAVLLAAVVVVTPRPSEDSTHAGAAALAAVRQPAAVSPVPRTRVAQDEPAPSMTPG